MESNNEMKFEQIETADLFEFADQPAQAGHKTNVAINTDMQYVPSVDQSYIFNRSTMKKLMIWITGMVSPNLYIGGPAGCGKSSVIEQFAARTKRPCFSVACHSNLDEEVLYGGFQLMLENGQQITRWVDGPLVMAAKMGGILLFDEYDYLSDSMKQSLNLVLDQGRPLMIKATGEVVQRHPEFRIAATANTFGQGDASGHYKGAKRANVANMDRFLFAGETYLEAKAEAKVLAANVGGLNLKTIGQLLELAKQIRAAFLGDAGEQIGITLSTRGLVRTAHCCVTLAGLKPDGSVNMDALMEGLDMGFLKQASEVDRELITQITQNIFG